MSDLTEISTEVIQAVSKEMAWQYRVIPRTNGSPLELYVEESVEKDALRDELEILLGKSVYLVGVDKEAIEYGLTKYYRKGNVEARDKTQTLDASSNDFIESLIKEAKSLDCSDIHLEPYENRCRVRMRLDGKLVERFVLCQ